MAGKSGVSFGDRTTVRSATYKNRAAAKRAARQGKARAYVAKATGGSAAARVLRNTRAISDLREKLYGPLQVQRSLGDEFTVVASKPVCFQINNPGYGQFGPAILRHAGALGGVERIGGFEKSTGMPFHAKDEDHLPNGPTLLLKSVHLQFKFEGYVDNTKIRIDVIRQKKAIDGDIWNPNTGDQTFMPHILNGLENLAGFTANEIDTSLFQVLATKHLFMNSKATSNFEDLAQDRPTTRPTTSNIAYCDLDLKLDKVCKQLLPSLDEKSGIDTADQNFDAHDEDGAESKGPYAYDNQHPLSNIWCLVSTDDQTALTALVDGDSVRCHVIRKCVWRDRRG